MKKKFCVVAALAVAVAGPATLAHASLNTGKLVSFGNGKVVINHKKAGKSAYTINKKTDCGVSYGNPPQSGDSIKCSKLSKDKYVGRPTFVRWSKVDGKKVAKVVSVN